MAAKEAAQLSAKLDSTGEQRANEFFRWAESFPDAPPLSDEAMYPDRW
jgi:hypothetical protein